MMMTSADTTNNPVFPFGLTAGGTQLNESTANAIDAHLMEITSLREPLPDDSHGSVLAVVTFPKDNKADRACDGKPWQDVRIRMSHEKLMSLGSKKIEDMFSPRAQARFCRRLGLEQLPPGIEYVVDFTPPSEGPELADLTAALWLPRTVKIWFLAGQYLPEPILETGLGFPRRLLADKAVGAILALGHDDVCKNTFCLTDFTSWKTRDGLPGIVEDNPPFGQNHIPAWRKVNDYCPIRHRVAIIRVLKAINGGDLLLNSAVRMWTVAQVAISLDVPQVVVDPVTQWLVAPPNTKFIEICPEKAFQLAYALKIPSVLITAFRILVNELAIDYASSEPSPGRSPLTWAQRRRDDYGDYPSDPVEYASRAFAERMSDLLKMLQSDDVFTRLPIRIPEWDRLQYLGTLIYAVDPGPLRTSYEILTAALLATFRKWIDKALKADAPFTGVMEDLLDAQRRHYIPDIERKPLLSLYTPLNPAQKALTPFFWVHLNCTEPLAAFLTTRHDNEQLRQPAHTFAAELHAALANRTIVPDLDHPTLEDTLHFNSDMTFDLNEFHRVLCIAVKQLCAAVLRTHRSADLGEPTGIPFFLSDHLLLSLDEHELNYLPIWADGLDDGSGGVFQEAIPKAEMGSSEPGPGYHTGYTAAGTGAVTETYGGDGDANGKAMTGASPPLSTVFAPSDLGVGVLSLRDRTIEFVSGASAAAGTTSGSGTVGGTLHAQRSGTTVSGAAPSESFTAGDEGVNADAGLAQPAAAHQAQGLAIERYADDAEAETEDGDGETSPRPSASAINRQTKMCKTPPDVCFQKDLERQFMAETLRECVQNLKGKQSVSTVEFAEPTNVDNLRNVYDVDLGKVDFDDPQLSSEREVEVTAIGNKGLLTDSVSRESLDHVVVVRGRTLAEDHSPLGKLDEAAVGNREDPLLFSITDQLQSAKPSQIWVTTSSQWSASNHLKGIIEDFFGEPWIWWPLKQRSRNIPAGKVRLHWICGCGRERSVDVSENFALQAIQAVGGESRTASDSVTLPRRAYLGSGKSAPSDHDESRHDASGESSRPNPAPSNAESNAQDGTDSGQHKVEDGYIFFVVASGPKIGDEHRLGQKKIDERTTTDEFFEWLQKKYFELRGFFRSSLSIRVYSHSDFYMFHKWDANKYGPVEHNSFPDTDSSYCYSPKPMSPVPPITEDQFYHRFYTCYKPRSFHKLLHKCRRPCRDRIALGRLPLRNRELEVESSKDEYFWGIYAVTRIAFARVVFYTVLCFIPAIFPSIAFFFLWLYSWGHEADLQNAAVPLGLSFALLTLLLSFVAWDATSERGPVRAGSACNIEASAPVAMPHISPPKPVPP